VQLVVELESVSVTLDEPDDTGRFSLRIEGPPGATPATHLHRLGDVLEGLGLGRLDAKAHEQAHAAETHTDAPAHGEVDVFIARDPLRFWAAGQVADDWDQRFDAMCEYAASKGWVDPTDGALQAHVEWPPA
jgi:hypothetical protein